MNLQQDDRDEKLRTLRATEGFESVETMLEAAAVDSVSPGICTKPERDGTTSVEPDQDAGWCEVCGGNTVVSALLLAGLV